MKLVNNTCALLILCSIALCANAQLDVVDTDSDGLLEIKTLDDLNAIRNDPTGKTLRGSSVGCPSGGCFGFELINNLDFDTNKNGQIDAGDWNLGRPWQPIAGFQYATFEGNSYSIANVLISVPDVVLNFYGYGLFGTSLNAKFRNLRLKRVTIIAEGSTMPSNALVSAGALVSYVRDTQISNISVDDVVVNFNRPSFLARLEQSSSIGGVIGLVDRNSTVTDIRMIGEVRVADELKDHWTGGLIGNILHSSLSSSRARGFVESGVAGGAIGLAASSQITNVFSTANVTGRNQVGGLIGVYYVAPSANAGWIESVYATGVVTGQSGGGLIGVTNLNNTSLEISSSYSAGATIMNGQSYAQMVGVVNTGSVILNSDSYQIEDPQGVVLTGFDGGYNRPIGMQALKCATNPTDISCIDPYAVESWSLAEWDFGNATQLPVLKQKSIYPWVSVDRPSSSGDYESVSAIKDAYPQYACDAPSDFYAKAQNSAYVFSAKTPEKFDFFNAKQGLQCTGSTQSDGRCDNYEVAYLCEGTANEAPQWSSWINKDTPANGVESELMPTNSAVCSNGRKTNGIRARVVGTTAEYLGAPQILSRFTVTSGLSCRNQDNGSGTSCLNYEARMVCSEKGAVTN